MIQRRRGRGTRVPKQTTYESLKTPCRSHGERPPVKPLDVYGEPMEGTPFGRYRLVELLGRGGMGEVWRAHDSSTDRVVAIKVISAKFSDDPMFQQRFRRQGDVAARLFAHQDDPHLVPIYDVGEVDGRLYVTMRLVDGRDLQALLNSGPLKPERAVAIIEQVAAALHATHQVGLVHGDVRPANILLTDDDFAYLIGFDIAHPAAETGLTNAAVGSLFYTAPEQFSTGAIGPRSEIYALACVLYQTLTAELPFPGTTLEQLAVAHMITPPPRPCQLNPAVPQAFDDVIATGLAKEPGQRFPTAQDLAAAARAAVSNPIRRSSPPSPSTESQRPDATPVVDQ